MRQRRKRMRQSVLLLGTSVLVLIGSLPPAEATPGYLVVESDASPLALSPDMNAYDPAVLSISFRQNPEIPHSKTAETPDADMLFSALQQQPSDNRQPEPQGEPTLSAALRQPVEPIGAPEPGTVALLGLGIIALAIQRWWRKRP